MDHLHFQRGTDLRAGDSQEGVHYCNSRLFRGIVIRRPLLPKAASGTGRGIDATFPGWRPCRSRRAQLPQVLAAGAPGPLAGRAGSRRRFPTTHLPTRAWRLKVPHGPPSSPAQSGGVTDDQTQAEKRSSHSGPPGAEPFALRLGPLHDFHLGFWVFFS